MSKRKSDTLLENSSQSDTKKHRRIDPVEKANAIPKKDFLRPALVPFAYEKEPDYVYSLDLVYADDLSAKQLNDCFSLIESTSRHDYEPSSFGWHPKRKLREMKEKEMRYIVLTKYGITSEATRAYHGYAGFMSFMFTHDSSPTVPVLYIYEIHLVEAARGCGLGKNLMDTAEKIARCLGMEKVMLTCFKSNKKAYNFYERMGYKIDVCSPKDIKTRKKVSKSDYVIMSLDLSDATQRSGGAESTEQDEDAQVTADDTEYSTGSADILKSSDRITESLEKCLSELKDECNSCINFDTAEDDVGKAFRAIDVSDTQSAILHASRLRARVEQYQTRTIAQVKFQAALWTQTHELRDLLDLVERKARIEGNELPEEVTRPPKMIASGLSDVEYNLMNQAIAGTTTRIVPSATETELSRQNSKVKALERQVALYQRQADQARAAVRAQERVLSKRESAVKVAETQVALRAKQIDDREARIAHKMEALAKVFDSDASLEEDSEAHSGQDSEDDDEEAFAENDEDDSTEQSQQQSATNTEYSDHSRPEREIAESDSEDEKPEKLTISKSLKLPTPEAMKWQRPRKDQVSTWLRRSGSARESFPSGKRASDI
ncbi:N-alpha-acetyltransferase 40 [Pseudocercospora fuligena]|uniref:N-alpha-acetyltransferase 40 n=1 Tax=Pseudocercospora fuligena TaxID=685502 RepID=A0A8H6RDQ9_9PEZI|nr:N-alpha-acetyltransferase 40 [Pseudocercospora fuligena]